MMKSLTLRVGAPAVVALAFALALACPALGDSSPTPGTASSARGNTPPAITVSPSSGSPGTRMTLSGSGFSASAQVLVDIAGARYDGGSTDSQGSFTFGFTFSGNTLGEQTACAYTVPKYACTQFVVTIPQASIVVSPTSVISSSGTYFNVVGSGFPPGSIVGIYMDSPAHLIGTPGAVADGQGNFTWLNTTELPVGSHVICGDTTAANATQTQIPATACAQFIVLPGVPGSPTPPMTLESPSPAVSISPTLDGRVATSSFLIPLVAGGLVIVLMLGSGIGALIWTRRRNRTKGGLRG